MKKGKKIVLALLTLCFTVCMLFVAACAADPPNEKPGGDYTFENTEEPLAETDADVTLDGSFDESFYAADKTHWYDWAQEMTSGHTIRVRMAVHFGEKGTYFAVDVDDAQVNFNAANRVNYNSSIELLFAAGHETNAVGKAYRYTFSAGGQTKWDIYSLNDYAEYGAPYGYAPRSAIVLKGGEIGEGCTGYKAEIFIPNEAIALTATPENMSVFLCANASYSSEAGAQLRQWKGFNIDQTAGEGWDRPDTWFQFDDTGLIANKVTITANGGGEAVYDYDYTLNGMANGITITPEAGYRVASFKQDGKKASAKLVTDENGVSRYEFTGAGRDTAFEVTFETVSSEVYTVSGTFGVGAFASAPTQEELIADIESISLQTATVSYEAKLDGDSYTVSAPAGSYTLKVLSARGYTLVSEQITLGGNVEKDIVLDENAWLGRYFVSLNDFAVTENAAYDSVMNEGIDAKTFTFGGRIAVPFDEGTIVPEVSFNYDGDRYVRLQLMNWSNAYCAKLIVSSCEDTQADLRSGTGMLAYADRLRENGGYVILTIDAASGKISVYLDDGDGFDCVLEQTAAWLAEGVLQDVQVRKTDDTLSRTVSFENGVLYTNCTDTGVFAGNLDAQMNLDTAEVCDGVKVSVSPAKVGQQATLTVTAEDEVGVTVTVNGEEIAASAENTYTFTAYFYNDIKVVAYAPAAFTATVTVPSGMEAIAKVEARPLSGGAAVELTLSEGKYNAQLIGEYEVWAVSESGFARLLGEIAVRGEAVSEEYILTEDTWTGGIVEAGAQVTADGSWRSVWEDETAEVKGTFAVAVALNVANLTKEASAETSAWLAFGSNSLRIDFQFNKDGNALRLGINNGDGWTSLNNVQDKFPAVYSSLMATGQIHVIFSVADDGWVVYLWNGLAYEQMTWDNVAGKFDNVTWLRGACLTAVQVKNSNVDVITVTADGCKLATGGNVGDLIASYPTAAAQLTVTASKEVAAYPDVAKLTVKINGAEKELTDGKITLARGTYEIWAYYASGTGRLIDTVTMNGEAQTKEFTLTAENWGTLQGKEILDAAVSSGYGNEQKIFEQSQTGALENFELNIDVDLNTWNGSAKGEATTMGTTFTGVVIVDFGNNKHLRVNLYKADDTWAALQVQLRDGNGGAQYQQEKAITSANGISELGSATSFSIKITVQGGKATVSVSFGERTVTVSDYDLTSFLGDNAALNYVGVRKSGSSADLVITVNSTIVALAAEQTTA